MGFPHLTAALAILCGLAQGQAFEPRKLDTNGLLGGDAPRFVRRGGTAVGLGVPLGGGGGQPVVWTDAGTQILPILANHELGDANAMNDGGMVVGASVDVVKVGQLLKFFETAVVWPPGGAALEVQSLVLSGPPLELFNTIDISSTGILVGVGRDASVPALRGWLLEGGVLSDLGSLVATGNLIPRDMNEAGQIVGEAGAAGGLDHAFLWQNGTLLDLHVAGGVAGFVSEANAINEAGMIVGGADLVADGIQLEEAAMWRPDGTLVSLGSLGGPQSTMRGINQRGDAVGFSTTPGSQVRAVLWRDGVLHDLNDLIPTNSGWTLLVANDISDDGIIVGEGAFGGTIRAYLLQPVCDSCTNYCTSTPNSSGGAAVMGSQGWESLAADSLTRTADNLPSGQFGLFFYGPAQTQVPFGNGLRCVAPGGVGLFRLPVGQADAGGRLSTRIDFTAPPATATLLPGTTWHFQAWFRDPAGGGASFDTSDGLSITFVR